jgi:hypothetical protein
MEPDGMMAVPDQSISQLLDRHRFQALARQVQEFAAPSR